MKDICDISTIGIFSCCVTFEKTKFAEKMTIEFGKYKLNL